MSLGMRFLVFRLNGWSIQWSLLDGAVSRNEGALSRKDLDWTKREVKIVSDWVTGCRGESLTKYGVKSGSSWSCKSVEYHSIASGNGKLQ